MPTELFTAIPQLAAIVERGGVIGLLLLAVAWLIYERLRLMKQNVKVFRERDMARLVRERYRSEIVAGGGKLPDIADIEKEFADVKES